MCVNCQDCEAVGKLFAVLWEKACLFPSGCEWLFHRHERQFSIFPWRKKIIQQSAGTPSAAHTTLPQSTAVWPPSDVPLDRAGWWLPGWRDRPVCTELYYRRRDRWLRPGMAVDCGSVVCAADGVPADCWMIFLRHGNKISIGGRHSMTLVIQRSCFCPCERLPPSSEITVSYPFGRRLIKL